MTGYEQMRAEMRILPALRHPETSRAVRGSSIYGQLPAATLSDWSMCIVLESEVICTQ